MTEKEKAKAYDEAIERAKKLYGNGITEEILPELKEDDTERIRKNCIHFLELQKQHHAATFEIEECIDWMEKQGKQKKQVHFPKFTFDDVLALQCCMETVNKVQEDKELYEQLNIIHSKIHDAYWLEKQCENSTDKIKPRFRVGDWIVFTTSGNLYKVDKKENYEYTLIDINGCSFCVSFSNKELVKKWTIQDAEDGDVLVDEDNNIGIFKKCEDKYWHSYIYLGCDGELRGFSIGGIHKQTNTNPATKEQCDALMKTINDAGYEWDSEKKELKKKD